MVHKFDTKIMLPNYNLYYGEPSYIGIFPADLAIPQIFADFQCCA